MSSDACLEYTFGWCTPDGVGHCCNNWSADEPNGQNYNSDEDALQACNTYIPNTNRGMRAALDTDCGTKKPTAPDTSPQSNG